MRCSRGRWPARRRTLSVLLVALVGGLILGVAGPSGQAEPAAAASSWKLVRNLQFSGSAIPGKCGTYGGPYSGGKSYWQPDDVLVSGGMLRLRLQKRVKSGYPYTSGGVGCWNWPQTYGRYEMRARVPAGRGIDSYLTLSPTKGGAKSWTGIELLAPGPETAYITNGFGTGTETVRAGGQYSGRFHTYVIEWAPKLTRVSVDGRVLYSSTKSYKGPRWPGLVISSGDALTGVPDATTRLPVEFQIDYLKVSAFTGVAPVVRPTPVVQAPGPSAQGRVLSVPSATPTAKPANPPPTNAVARSIGTLPGGVWPWLLGGSVIAVLAVGGLGHRGGGRADEPDPEDDHRIHPATGRDVMAGQRGPDATTDAPTPSDAGVKAPAGSGWSGWDAVLDPTADARWDAGPGATAGGTADARWDAAPSAPADAPAQAGNRRRATIDWDRLDRP